MILSTHSIIAAALVSTMPNHPILGGSLAFASHFILDTIPHWDYTIESFQSTEAQKLMTGTGTSKTIAMESTDVMKRSSGSGAMARDMSRVLIDSIIGFTLVWLFYGRFGHTQLYFSAAFLAMLPDGLQFIYAKFPVKPLQYLQKFHMWIHTKHKIKNKPLFGITSQALISLFFIAIFYLIAI